MAGQRPRRDCSYRRYRRRTIHHLEKLLAQAQLLRRTHQNSHLRWGSKDEQADFARQHPLNEGADHAPVLGQAVMVGRELVDLPATALDRFGQSGAGLVSGKRYRHPLAMDIESFHQLDQPLGCGRFRQEAGCKVVSLEGTFALGATGDHDDVSESVL